MGYGDKGTNNLHVQNINQSHRNTCNALFEKIIDNDVCMMLNESIDHDTSLMQTEQEGPDNFEELSLAQVRLHIEFKHPK